MIRSALLLSAIALVTPRAALAQEGAMCSPTTTTALILASPDENDIHPSWTDGSEIGLAWTLDVQSEEEGADGTRYLSGNLIDPRGNVADQGVTVRADEWECDAN